MKPVLVRTFVQDKKNYIILSGYSKSDTAAYSQVLQFANGKFNVVARNVRRYLNVVKIPPLYASTLIMQDSDRSKVVSGAVYEGRISGDDVVRGGKLSNLPKQATVFNFAWIPADKGKRGDHLALIAEKRNARHLRCARQPRSRHGRHLQRQLRVRGEANRRHRARSPRAAKAPTPCSTTCPCACPWWISITTAVTNSLPTSPSPTAGKLFSNYRTYPQGEIHAMLWNGMGMELLWKTRRIKGTVCDVAVMDANNNGKLDLIVAVNSYAGLTTGIKTRCAVYLYPLDTTKVNAKPNYQE